MMSLGGAEITLDSQQLAIRHDTNGEQELPFQDLDLFLFFQSLVAVRPVPSLCQCVAQPQ